MSRDPAFPKQLKIYKANPKSSGRNFIGWKPSDG